MIKVYPIKNRREIKAFIDLPWRIYKGDPNWVPPLKHQMKNILLGKNNPLFARGPHVCLMAYHGKTPVGRVCVGINHRLNEEKQKKEGYLTLFESINDQEAAFALLDYAQSWLKNQGMQSMTGPVSPTNGDDQRGLLIKGFDGPPVLMNSYTPPYYHSFFTDFGFKKEMDLYAYAFMPDKLPVQRFGRVVEYAMKRYKFRIDRINLKDIDREILDIKSIIDRSMPDSWEHLVAPSFEELKAEFYQLKPFIDPDILFIARSDSEPIGFVMALPDYNQVLKHMNGRLFPLGFLKFFLLRKRIDGVRIFAQFVVPKYRNKAVNSAIFYKLMVEGRKKGYRFGEGSTIAEMNKESIRSVEGAGGELYRIYRIYRKDF